MLGAFYVSTTYPDQLFYFIKMGGRSLYECLVFWLRGLVFLWFQYCTIYAILLDTQHRHDGVSCLLT